MELVKYPRGRAHARAIDAPPIPEPDRHLEQASPPPADSEDAEWLGWRATDEFGRTVGRVEARIGDQWLIVRDRRAHHLLVPAVEAIAGGDAVFLPYPHEQIDAAPQVGKGEEEVSEALLQEAWRHYATTPET